MSLLKLSQARQLVDWCILWPDLAKVLQQQPLATQPFFRLVHDSRLVEKGDVFFALNGTQQKGLAFVEEAWQQGALLAVTEGDLALEKQAQGWLLTLPNLAARLGQLLIVNTQAPVQAIRTHAITGTNGKSSVAHYLCQAWRLLARRTALVGTLGNGELDNLQTATHTTPDLFTLHQLYADWAAQGITQVALEASSHALDQGRLDGLRMTSAIYTNLTRDHLDYHGCFAAYVGAKQRLFLRPELEVAVINADDAVGQDWLVALQMAGLHNPSALPKKLFSYSLKPALALGLEQNSGLEKNSGLEQNLGLEQSNNLNPVLALNVQQANYSLLGIQAEFTYLEQTWSLNLPLLGAFNLANALAVVAALLAEGIAMPLILKVMQQLQPVPGRMQRVILADAKEQALPQVVVDYAHSPDALEQALLALQQHCQGKLWCVFGCGGDRDVGKRFLMGEVAQSLANQVLITDDNPRYENPAAIRQAILAGASVHKNANKNANKNVSILEVADRKQAIQMAVQQAAAEDWILIAGKGHEVWQEAAGKRVHFNDAEEALLALDARQTLNLKQVIKRTTKKVSCQP